jgi:CDP-diacylglycerol--glycerol-3-phosphate 3-phosphatidyltransferase
MLRTPLKDGTTRVISPLAKALLAIGVTANAMTVVGAFGSWLASLYFFSSGQFFLGTLVVTFFVLSDLFDGTMARLSGRSGTRLGALLDSTLDRITDAIMIVAIFFWAKGNEPSLLIPLLLALASGFLISYIKARAEALSIPCDVGIAERAERLIVILVSTGLFGLGVDQALALGIWLLVVINLITVVQRFYTVLKNA